MRYIVDKNGMVTFVKSTQSVVKVAKEVQKQTKESKQYLRGDTSPLLGTLNLRFKNKVSWKPKGDTIAEFKIDKKLNKSHTLGRKR